VTFAVAQKPLYVCTLWFEYVLQLVDK